jgi:hypothetical protein
MLYRPLIQILVQNQVFIAFDQVIVAKLNTKTFNVPTVKNMKPE